MGVNVGKEDPAIDPYPGGFTADPDMPVIGGIGGSGCSNSNPYCQQCYLDGTRVECAQVAFLSEIGAAMVAPAQTFRWNPDVVNERGSRGAYEFFHAFNNGYDGWMTSYGYDHYEGGSSFYNSPYDDYNESRSHLTRSLGGFFGHGQNSQDPECAEPMLIPFRLRDSHERIPSEEENINLIHSAVAVQFSAA